MYNNGWSGPGIKDEDKQDVKWDNIVIFRLIRYKSDHIHTTRPPICWLCSMINQSINQISIVPIFPVLPCSVVGQANQCSTAKSMKQFHNITGQQACRCLWGEGKSKRCVLGCFLKIWVSSARGLLKDPLDWHQRLPLYFCRVEIPQYCLIRKMPLCSLQGRPFFFTLHPLARGKSGFISRLVPLNKTPYHACFICGQRCNWWSRRPKMTSSVISDVKTVIYLFLKIQILLVTLLWRAPRGGEY